MTTRAAWPRLLPVALLALAACAPASGQEPRAQITELPLRPLSISDSDFVAGATRDQHAATWNAKSGLQRVPLAAEFTFSECTSINSRGDAVGTASTPDSSRRVAFIVRHRASGQSKFAILPGEQSRANAINDDGIIVGQSILPGDKSTGPVMWKHDLPLRLDVCCAGMARSINAQGTIAGDTYDQAGHYHAFVWDATRGAVLLAAPDEQYSSALTLNNSGVVLLKATPGGLFLVSHDQRQPLDIPKATPRAMNNGGIIVGSFGPAPDAQRAFVWDKIHGLRDLNSLLPAGSGWTLEVASSINDRGEIVGWGDHNGVQNTGFLLRLPAEAPTPRNR